MRLACFNPWERGHPARRRCRGCNGHCSLMNANLVTDWDEVRGGGHLQRNIDSTVDQEMSLGRLLEGIDEGDGACRGRSESCRGGRLDVTPERVNVTEETAETGE